MLGYKVSDKVVHFQYLRVLQRLGGAEACGDGNHYSLPEAKFQLPIYSE